MLRTRNFNRWMHKQISRHESQVGWDTHHGEFHRRRRNPTFMSKGVGYSRKSFGRRPFATFGKRSFASRLSAKA